MGWNGAARAVEAAHRKQQRGQVKRMRELDRRAKEQEKRSTLEQARLEVERHEAHLELLLSIHREPVEAWNWERNRLDGFRLPVDRLRDAVANRSVDVSFTLVAEAREYRESLALDKMNPEDRRKFSELQDEMGDSE
jgi:hypothetical protein